MKTEISIASDYAVLTCANGMRFYYGYEVTEPEKPGEDEDSEWCFEFRYKRIRTKIPSSCLGMKEQWDPAAGLLLGIGKWLCLSPERISEVVES